MLYWNKTVYFSYLFALGLALTAGSMRGMKYGNNTSPKLSYVEVPNYYGIPVSKQDLYKQYIPGSDAPYWTVPTEQRMSESKRKSADGAFPITWPISNEQHQQLLPHFPLPSIGQLGQMFPNSYMLSKDQKKDDSPKDDSLKLKHASWARSYNKPHQAFYNQYLQWNNWITLQLLQERLLAPAYYPEAHHIDPQVRSNPGIEPKQFPPLNSAAMHHGFNSTCLDSIRLRNPNELIGKELIGYTVCKALGLLPPALQKENMPLNEQMKISWTDWILNTKRERLIQDQLKKAKATQEAFAEIVQIKEKIKQQQQLEDECHAAREQIEQQQQKEYDAAKQLMIQTVQQQQLQYECEAAKEFIMQQEQDAYEAAQKLIMQTVERQQLQDEYEATKKQIEQTQQDECKKLVAELEKNKQEENLSAWPLLSSTSTPTSLSRSLTPTPPDTASTSSQVSSSPRKRTGDGKTRRDQVRQEQRTAKKAANQQATLEKQAKAEQDAQQNKDEKRQRKIAAQNQRLLEEAHQARCAMLTQEEAAARKALETEFLSDIQPMLSEFQQKIQALQPCQQAYERDRQIAEKNRIRQELEELKQEKIRAQKKAEHLNQQANERMLFVEDEAASRKELAHELTIQKAHLMVEAIDSKKDVETASKQRWAKLLTLCTELKQCIVDTQSPTWAQMKKAKNAFLGTMSSWLSGTPSSATPERPREEIEDDIQKILATDPTVASRTMEETTQDRKITLLHFATMAQSEQLVDACLEALTKTQQLKAVINAPDLKNRTAIEYALRLENKETTSALIKGGACIPDKEIIETFCYCSTDFFMHLLDQLPLKQKQDALLHTLHGAFHPAFTQNQPVEELQQKQAALLAHPETPAVINERPIVAGKAQATLLEVALDCRLPDATIKRLLDSGANPSKEDSKGGTSLHYVVQKLPLPKLQIILPLLLKHTNEHNWQPAGSPKKKKGRAQTQSPQPMTLETSLKYTASLRNAFNDERRNKIDQKAAKTIVEEAFKAHRAEMHRYAEETP